MLIQHFRPNIGRPPIYCIPNKLRTPKNQLKIIHIKVRTQTFCILLCQSSSCSFTKEVIIGHKSIICKLEKFFNRCNWIAFHLDLLIVNKQKFVCFILASNYSNIPLKLYIVFLKICYKYKQPKGSSILKILPLLLEITVNRFHLDAATSTPKYVLILEIASGKG